MTDKLSRFAEVVEILQQIVDAGDVILCSHYIDALDSDGCDHQQVLMELNPRTLQLNPRSSQGYHIADIGKMVKSAIARLPR